MSRFTRFVRAISILLALLAATHSFGQVGATTSQQPVTNASEVVTVVGRLEFAGSNYFLDPRFELVDDQNNRVQVSLWAPLELPPSPPSQAQQAHGALRTMQDYLGKRLQVTGVYRAAAEVAGRARSSSQVGESYVEVTSVVDVASGARVFQSNSGTAVMRSTPEPGARPARDPQAAVPVHGAIVSPQPTEPQRPAGPAKPMPSVEPAKPQRSPVSSKGTSVSAQPTEPQKAAEPAKATSGPVPAEIPPSSAPSKGTDIGPLPTEPQRPAVPIKPMSGPETTEPPRSSIPSNGTDIALTPTELSRPTAPAAQSTTGSQRTELAREPQQSPRTRVEKKS